MQRALKERKRVEWIYKIFRKWNDILEHSLKFWAGIQAFLPPFGSEIKTIMHTRWSWCVLRTKWCVRVPYQLIKCINKRKKVSSGDMHSCCVRKQATLWRHERASPSNCKCCILYLLSFLPGVWLKSVNRSVFCDNKRIGSTVAIKHFFPGAKCTITLLFFFLEWWWSSFFFRKTHLRRNASEKCGCCGTLFNLQCAEKYTSREKNVLHLVPLLQQLFLPYFISNLILLVKWVILSQRNGFFINYPRASLHTST